MHDGGGGGVAGDVDEAGGDVAFYGGDAGKGVQRLRDIFDARLAGERDREGCLVYVALVG